MKLVDRWNQNVYTLLKVNWIKESEFRKHGSFLKFIILLSLSANRIPASKWLCKKANAKKILLHKFGRVKLSTLFHLITSSRKHTHQTQPNSTQLNSCINKNSSTSLGRVHHQLYTFLMHRKVKRPITIFLFLILIFLSLFRTL